MTSAATSLIKLKSVADLESYIKELERQLSLANKELSQKLDSTVSPESHNESTTDQHHRSLVESKFETRSTLATPPPGKSGYLFKWQDRSIGWGGTKWDLRFVVLERGRLSYYRSHLDAAPRYALTLRRCAVRDDGQRINQKYKRKITGEEPPSSESGAYFHIFSIYQRPHDKSVTEIATNSSVHNSSATTTDENEGQIVPLLRFSSSSLAEKTQWIDLISEACAYCDSDDFVAEIPPITSMLQGTSTGMFVPPLLHDTRGGTIPPMYFASAAPRSPHSPSSRYFRNQKGKTHRNMNSDGGAATSSSKKKNSYPPSKPMHRVSGPSYLSDEAPMQNYRGLLNLSLIVLVISNFRLIMGTMREHGFVLARGFLVVSNFTDDPLTEFPFISGMVLLQFFIVYTYIVESFLGRGVIGENIGMALHAINVNLSLIAPMLIVWCFVTRPVTGGILLLTATITWMKLISYVHANADYRMAPDPNALKATLSLLRDLDEDSKDISYPRNVTLSNIYYFWLAPTLTYQIAFPRSRRVRPLRVATLLLRFFICLSLIVFLVAQVIVPALDNLVEDLEANQENVFTPHIIVDYLLKLAIANTYVWLLVFYGYFHVYLNIFAELLRFGDRVFYRDWWNSSNVSAYWRLWNLPVHYWLVRHVYFPCIRLRLSKSVAMFIVFFLSAIFHELLISIPFHMIRPWSFLGMIGQIPLVMITKYFDRIRPGSSVGNVFFWLTFCILGQPMAVLMYTIDSWKLNKNTAIELEPIFEVAAQECKKFLWFKKCHMS